MKTKENLLKAFAGECQARARYEMASKMAKDNGLEILSRVFTFTASQEQQHAIVFYDWLKKTFNEENISINGNYPIDLENDLKSLLENAMNNENDEATIIYQEFGNVAKEEGYPEIASTFYMISDIEEYHSKRFKYYLNKLSTNTLFNATQNTYWMCLNCGFIYEGNQALQVCPVCNYPQGFAILLKESPFNV